MSNKQSTPCVSPRNQPPPLSLLPSHKLTLLLHSPVASLDGLYLTTSPSSTALTTASSGTTTGSGGDTVRFYPVRDPTTGLSELRAADSSGAALAVVGANGLLDFSSLADPAAVAVPVGTTVDWTSFRLEGGDVKYAGAGGEGRWVAFPTAGGVVERSSREEGALAPVKRGEGWSVKWKDGELGSLCLFLFPAVCSQ